VGIHVDVRWVELTDEERASLTGEDIPEARCPECGCVPESGRVVGEPGECACDEETLCVEVRAGEPLAVSPERRAGEVVYLEQCDECGCACFEVVSGGARGGVRCIGEDDDETEQRAEGCGRFIPFQLRPAREVIF